MYKQKTKRLVLGEGETIGHKHVLQTKSPLEFDKGSDGIKILLNSMGILTHDEHDLMVLTPAKYRSYHQVEFNPLDNTVNRVFD